MGTEPQVDSRPLVFLSWSGPDLRAATELCSLLEARHLRAWFSPRDAVAGQHHSGQIGTVIPTCAAMVVLLSDAALDSVNVAREVALAVDFKLRLYAVTAPGFHYERSRLPPGLLYLVHAGGNVQTDGDLGGVAAQVGDDLLPPRPQPRTFAVATTNPRAFVGQARERFVAHLCQDWAQVCSTRRARMVVLLAESGYGKTRIVQEFYRHLARSQPQPGFWPGELAGDPGEGHQALRDSRKRVSPAELNPPPGARAEYLWLGHAVNEGFGGRVDHGLADLGSELARALDLAVRADPHGSAAVMVSAALGAPHPGRDLRRELTELLHHGDRNAGSGVAPGSVEAFWQGLRQLWAAESLPMVVAIEDGHEAGQSSVSVLEQLAGSADLPFLVLVCAQESRLGRQGDANRPRRPLGLLLDQGLSAVSARTVDRLTDTEIDRLVREAIPELDEGTRGAAIRKVDGNPYYARTLLLAMAEAAATGRLSRAWVEKRPARFEDELRLQWEDLDPSTRWVLCGISVLGTQVPERLASHALGVAGRDDRAAALDASVASGWLRRLLMQSDPGDRASTGGKAAALLASLRSDAALRFLERPRWVIAHAAAQSDWDPVERQRIITNALEVLESMSASPGLTSPLLHDLHLSLALEADREGCRFSRPAAVRSGLAAALRLRLAADHAALLAVAEDVESLVPGHEQQPQMGPLAVESALALRQARASQPGGGTDPATAAAAELAVARAVQWAQQRPDLLARAHASLARASRSRHDPVSQLRSEDHLHLALEALDRMPVDEPAARAEVLHACALNAKAYGDDLGAAQFAAERVRILETTYSPLDHRVTAAMGNWAYYLNRCDNAEAVRVRRELLGRRLAAWQDPRRGPVAYAQKELAYSLIREDSQMHLVAAVELAEQALETRQLLGGREHPDTLSARAVLVATLLRRGDDLVAAQSLAARRLWERARELSAQNLAWTSATASPAVRGMRTRTLALCRIRLGDPTAVDDLHQELARLQAHPNLGSQAPVELAILWVAAEIVAAHVRFGDRPAAARVAGDTGLVVTGRYPDDQPRGWASRDPRHARVGLL